MLPKISIVIPVLNRVKTVEKAIESVVSQDYPNLELIIIDGGSTDGTNEIVKKYQKYLSYWHSKPDGNPSIAMNIGITKATGDLVAILMADDWYEADILWQVAQAYSRDPSADVYSCGGRIVNENGDLLKLYDTKKELALTLYNVCFAVSAICCRFISLSLYEKVGLFPTSNAEGRNMLCNDKEFLLRAIVIGIKEIFVPVIGHNYLASPASSTFGNHKTSTLSLLQDHCWIAETYLHRKDLSLWQRWIFHYWWMDQTTRLILYDCLEKDWSLARGRMKVGFKRYWLIWPFVVSWSTAQIVIKRLISWVASPSTRND